MKSQIEYPLTEEAKETARRLANAWNRGEIRQHTVSAAFWSEVELKKDEYSDSGVKVSLDTLLELSRFGLVDVNRPYSPDSNDKTIEVLLLQELRNAVENGFIVSDFFLTLNTVGAVVHGDLVMEPGSTFQALQLSGGTLTKQSRNWLMVWLRRLGLKS